MIPNAYCHKENNILIVLIEFDDTWKGKKEYYVKISSIINFNNDEILSGGSRVGMKWRGKLYKGTIVHKSKDFSYPGAGTSGISSNVVESKDFSNPDAGTSGISSNVVESKDFSNPDAGSSGKSSKVVECIDTNTQESYGELNFLHIFVIIALFLTLFIILDSEDDLPISQLILPKSERKRNAATEGLVNTLRIAYDEKDVLDDSDNDITYEPPINNSDLDMDIFKVVDTDEGAIQHDPEPEDFYVEPGNDEPLEPVPKKRKVNKRKEASQARVSGRKHISAYTGKERPDKRIVIRDSCEGKCRRQCQTVDFNRRVAINESFWEMGDQQRQRDFLLTLVEYKTTAAGKEDSRRNQSIKYFLPNNDGSKINVCKRLFLDTFNVSERVILYGISKVNNERILPSDNRGGRRENQKTSDADLRSSIIEHINRFPRVPSHYCRKDSDKEYLHSDLTLQIMYNMYKSSGKQGSISLYRSVFNDMKLSFFRPKKDLCDICDTYRNGSDETKETMQQTYEDHEREKELTRKIKQSEKERASNNNTHCAASFDLQQVLYLPQSNRCEIFYKRRLAVYNETIYEFATHDGYCFTWPETISKRGTNEVSSILNNWLQRKDHAGFRSISLFCDGCPGQNLNTIFPAMLLHFIHNSSSINEVTVHYFVPHHGQNEGDSMHATIERAVRKAGDIQLPCQLASIMRLSRSTGKPYVVNELQFSDIRDWKQMSTEIKMLSQRECESGFQVDWRKITTIRVEKSPEQHSPILYLKSSHSDESFQRLHIRMPRAFNWATIPSQIRSEQIGIGKEKLNDLMSLTVGETALLRSTESVNFYKSLKA